MAFLPVITFLAAMLALAVFPHAAVGACDYSLSAVTFDVKRSTNPVGLNPTRYLYTHWVINTCSSALTVLRFADCYDWSDAAYPAGNFGPNGVIVKTLPVSGKTHCVLNYGGPEGNVQVPANSQVAFQYVRTTAYQWCKMNATWVNGKRAGYSASVLCV